MNVVATVSTKSRKMSDTSMTRKVIHTDVDTGLSVVNDSGDEQDDEVLL